MTEIKDELNKLENYNPDESNGDNKHVIITEELRIRIKENLKETGLVVDNEFVDKLTKSKCFVKTLLTNSLKEGTIEDELNKFMINELKYQSKQRDVYIKILTLTELMIDKEISKQEK